MPQVGAPREERIEVNGIALNVRDWGGPMRDLTPGATRLPHLTPGAMRLPLSSEERGLGEDVSGATSPTPLLLLHGLASASRIWDLVAPILAQDRRVIALDQRGHGRSEKPDTGYDFATIVADDVAAAAKLGLGERYAVAGHSWGANVALELAAYLTPQPPLLGGEGEARR